MTKAWQFGQVRLLRHLGTARQLGNRRRVSIIPRDRPILWCDIVTEIKENLITVAPATAFGWIVALNNRMAGAVKMRGRMTVGRGIAAADMPASPADPQMNPPAPDLQTFLAAACAWRHLPDRTNV